MTLSYWHRRLLDAILSAQVTAAVYYPHTVEAAWSVVLGVCLAGILVERVTGESVTPERIRTVVAN